MHLQTLFNFPRFHGLDGLVFPTFINWVFDDRFDFGIEAFHVVQSSGLDRPEIMNGFMIGRWVGSPTAKPFINPNLAN